MDLISEKELLKQLGISRQTMWRYKTNGLKYYKVLGKTYFRPSEINAYIDQFASHYSPKTNVRNDNSIR